jgi:hypothetical protein
MGKHVGMPKMVWQVHHVHQLNGNARYNYNKIMTFNFICINISIISIIYLKTDLTTGAGVCAGDTTPDPNTSYCSGTECNSFSGKTCWNPKSGGPLSQTCSPNQFQCQVCASSYLIHNLI